MGSENIQGVPPLLEGEAFSEQYTDGSSNLKLQLRSDEDLEEDDALSDATARWVRDGTFDAVLIFPCEHYRTKSRAAIIKARSCKFCTTSRLTSPKLR